MNKAPGCVFTTLHFICNLGTGQKVRLFVTARPFLLSVMEQPNLFGRFVSYEENGVLRICTQILNSDFLIGIALSVSTRISSGIG